ncbi:aminotransferase [Burkholderia humptydooensis]|nr:aminotransferase [Burkholderia humptydooensis]EIP86595.1 putative aminotransferase [Burkholderia humptydooensis MSMB43]
MCEAAPRGLIYVANPNNPTGTVTPHDALRRLPSDRRPGTTVLVDEAYIEYSTNRRCSTRYVRTWG